MGEATYERKLCMASKVPGVAGPANFQHRLAEGLRKRGWTVSYGLNDLSCSAVLVIGGSREFVRLWKARRLGIPIIQRLDGMNWIHRRTRTGVLHFLRAELNNLVLQIIRNRYADWIVYQSEFAQRWWERKHGPSEVGKSVIYNGVPLGTYSPGSEDQLASDRIVLLMVEANLSGGYEVGLETGVHLARGVSARISKKLELVVVGNVPQQLKHKFSKEGSFDLKWAGLVPAHDVPFFYRSAHLFYAGDLNPACPNAVIESLACGLPVVAFDTGAIPEIVMGNSGRVVPYGGDVWKLDSPDIESLVQGAQEVINNQSTFRTGARRRAVESFDVDRMTEEYIAVFETSCKG